MRILLFVSCVLFGILSLSATASTIDTQTRMADESLNAAYKSLMDQLGDNEKKRLQNAQRAWITFRDRACAFESYLQQQSADDWIGQQTTPAQDVRCIQRLTLERLADLRKYIEQARKDTVPIVRHPPSDRFSNCHIANLPQSFTVQAIGVYEGAGGTDVQLDSSGHETKSIEVIVNRPEENVVVVLMAYDPVLWSIKRTADTNIVAVLVGGYHAQAVLGIERSIPLIITTYKGRKDCNQPFNAYKAGKNLLQANAIVRDLTGREIDHMWSNYRGDKAYIGSPPSAAINLVSSGDYRPEDYSDLPRFPSGQKGLDRLIELGLLRRASSADLNAWVAKASEKYKRFNPELKVKKPFAPKGIYVVLDKMNYPTGLYGGNSAAFLIPPGVPVPDGNPGHSAIYFLEDGSCRGPICRANE